MSQPRAGARVVAETPPDTDPQQEAQVEEHPTEGHQTEGHQSEERLGDEAPRSDGDDQAAVEPTQAAAPQTSEEADPETAGWGPDADLDGPIEPSEEQQEAVDQVAPETLGWTPVSGDPSSDDLDLSYSDVSDSESNSPGAWFSSEDDDDLDRDSMTVIEWASEPPPFDVPSPDGDGPTQPPPPGRTDQASTPSNDTDEEA